MNPAQTQRPLDSVTITRLVEAADTVVWRYYEFIEQVDEEMRETSLTREVKVLAAALADFHRPILAEGGESEPDRVDAPAQIQSYAWGRCQHRVRLRPGHAGERCDIGIGHDSAHRAPSGISWASGIEADYVPALELDVEAFNRSADWARSLRPPMRPARYDCRYCGSKNVTAVWSDRLRQRYHVSGDELCGPVTSYEMTCLCGNPFAPITTSSNSPDNVSGRRNSSSAPSSGLHNKEGS